MYIAFTTTCFITIVAFAYFLSTCIIGCQIVTCITSGASLESVTFTSWSFHKFAILTSTFVEQATLPFHKMITTYTFITCIGIIGTNARAQRKFSALCAQISLTWIIGYTLWRGTAINRKSRLQQTISVPTASTMILKFSVFQGNKLPILTYSAICYISNNTLKKKNQYIYIYICMFVYIYICIWIYT